MSYGPKLHSLSEAQLSGLRPSLNSEPPYRPLRYICRRCHKNKTDCFFCEPCREEINEKYKTDEDDE